MDESMARRWMWDFDTARETVCDRKRLISRYGGTQKSQNQRIRRMCNFIANDRCIKKARLLYFCKILRDFRSVALYRKR